MTNDDLRFGIEAAKKGEFENAKSHLARAVKNNPNSEEGWLWLGNCLTDTEQRKFCYERVLKINPLNSKAQHELDNIFLSSSISHSEVNSSLSKDTPVTSEEKPEKTNWKSNPLFLRIMGAIAGCFVCGIPFLFIIYSGLLDPLAGTTTYDILDESQLIPPLMISPPTMDSENGYPTSVYPNPQFSADANIRKIRELISQERHAEAIILLDQVIQSSPELDEPYFLRAYCYYALMKRQRSQSEFQDYLGRAMEDIDKAIAIRSDNGDYYMLRQYILVDLASLQDYQANAQHISQYALENAFAALNLGTTLDEYPDRIYVTDLIFVNRCEEALQKLSEMIEQTDRQNPSIGGLYHMQSQAYICMDKVDKAILMVDKSMFNNTNMEWKYELKSRYLYQAGRNNEALQILNELIEEKPSYDGWRYFLRALIYQEMGEREKAEENLILGMANTWSRAGLFSYVKGKMALEDGNIEEGIALLQQAEATLEYLFAPLQKRIQSELKELDSHSLVITPSVMLNVTSIPPMPIRPTARPLQTPVALDTPIVTVTPTPGISYPFNVEESIIVDLETGTGKLTLLPNDYPLLRFQPAEPIPVKEVKSLVVHLFPSSPKNQNPDIQIYFWIPRSGGWRYIAPTWGANPIEQSRDYVLPEGDIFLAIRNWGSETVTFETITVTLVVETFDGAIKTYGQK